jgi:hypothetical protein
MTWLQSYKHMHVGRRAGVVYFLVLDVARCLSMDSDPQDIDGYYTGCYELARLILWRRSVPTSLVREVCL